MPPAATTLQPPATTGPAATPAGQPAPALVPFNRASIRRTEFGNLDDSRVPGAASTTTTIDVPASGFLRHVWIQVACTGGTGTAAVARADAPWSHIESVVLRDINGAPIYGPVSGYELMLSNLIGGYSGVGVAADPSTWATYSAVANTGNFSYAVRVPVELRTRDGLGSLPNMNAAANYQLEIVHSAQTGIYSANPTGQGTVRTRATLETWSNPNTANALGQPQAVTPPALGTTQHWSRNVQSVSVGDQTYQLKRVGNLIRCIVLIARDSSGVRSDSVLPSNTIELRWDTRSVRLETMEYHRARFREVFGFALPTGVACFFFHDDFGGFAGEELNDSWLQTVQSSRLEIIGTTGAAGTWTALVNDVVPNGNVFGG